MKDNDKNGNKFIIKLGITVLVIGFLINIYAINGDKSFAFICFIAIVFLFYLLFFKSE